MKKFIGKFNDRTTFDPTEKTVVSVRDGVLEYAGVEIGMEPKDKTFRVYRSPATIANAAMRMMGIRVTDNHTDFESEANVGAVKSSEMFDAANVGTDTTIAVRNKIEISDTSIKTDGRELSLGYEAVLTESINPEYDFEQTDIKPNHLAIVDAGRCGSMCSFIDQIKPTHKPEKETKNMDKLKSLLAAFADSKADGKEEMTDEQIKAQACDALPEIVAFADAAQLEKFANAINAINAVLPKTEDKEGEKNFADSQEFSDAVAAKAKEMAVSIAAEHARIVDSARKHLPEDYAFADKSGVEIMRDAVATQNSHTFADSEISVAFKMLQEPAKPSMYAQFGDASTASAWDSAGDKEIGGN